MTKNNKKGFTIIEVVLVLAIAGLIFLMVFIALPALQRSQRNTRRRQDMARVLSAVNDYQANNNGNVPKSGEELKNFVSRYLDESCTADTGTWYANTSNCGDQFKDPDGTGYNIMSRGTSGGYVDQDSGTDYYKVDMGNTSGANKGFNHQILLVHGYVCSDIEGKVKKAAGNNIVSVLYTLEGGAIYCGDNE